MPVAPLEAARLFVQKITSRSCVLVAISGGSDSTGLLLALHQALRDLGRQDISLQAVTIDHMLRPESGEEAEGVAAFCLTLGVPHHLLRWEGQKPKAGLSAAARVARYALIGTVAGEIEADMVVVGHTLGDQQETIAMRGARSDRPDNLGLAGMADAVLYDARHWVLRPFLTVTRRDIRDFLVAQGQSWYDDPSNDDATYERVRVRNTPREAQRTLIDQSINRLAMSSESARLIEQFATYCGYGLVALDAGCLAGNSTTVRHALSALACVIGGRRFALGAASMDKVLAFAKAGEQGRVTASRVVFERRRDTLFLMRENRDIPHVTVARGASIRWDERFDITNLSSSDITVRGFGTCDISIPDEVGPSVPSGIVKRALQAMPIYGGEGDAPALTPPPGVTSQFRLAPYDLFLTRFDFELANTIARLVGRFAYPRPPV
ncbi:tRNA(Ile)-lysidine synthase [Rhizobium skierniewicense]|uniref:tRNA(Ile)-lysidine synthase n=1 Tax=Rhizobium skierniewicense TaxID=984260 RepID=A0A7W6C8R5_9HYPH|nr:tRNA lysidine(34) synthetase TilS [Rhizobium skierniewicense]MBB3946033.1 tRNA(Ile)-lysidine synthase [Rhizobium skierniewicense]